MTNIFYLGTSNVCVKMSKITIVVEMIMFNCQISAGKWRFIHILTYFSNMLKQAQTSFNIFNVISLADAFKSVQIL